MILELDPVRIANLWVGYDICHCEELEPGFAPLVGVVTILNIAIMEGRRLMLNDLSDSKDYSH